MAEHPTSADTSQGGQQQPPAAAQAPAAPPRNWPPVADRVLLGKSIKRLDGPDKASGRARYTYDLIRPGMLYGEILGSPHPRARVKAIDLSAAKALSGVRAVIAIKDPVDAARSGINYQGEEVAAVAATTEEIARDAVRLIKVEYDVLQPLATIEQARNPNTPPAFPNGNVSKPNVRQEGDVEAALKTAAHVVEGLYQTQVQTHTSLETHGGIAEWDGDKLTLFISTQGINASRDGIADALKVPRPNVRVVTEYMGGGFGSKLGADVQVVIAARLAKEAGAPVKIMLDRKHEHLITGNRPSAFARVKAGVDAEGKFVGWDSETWGTGGAGAGAGFSVPYPVYAPPAGGTWGFANRRQTHVDVYTNAGPQRAFRAPGHPQACFITETVIDELADRLRLDPLELRLRNLAPEAPNAQWRKYFAMGAEKIGWSRRHPTGDAAAGPIKRGLGCAANVWAGGGNRQTRAMCEIHPDGSVINKIATQDIGTGTRTLVAMITAETMGLPLNAVTAAIGDTSYPFAPGSGGSITVGSVSPTVRVSAENALRELFARVAPQLETTPDALEAKGGRIQVKGTPAKGIAWRDACKLLGTTPIQAAGEWTQGLSGVGTSGVQFADVEVDIETGITRVRKIVSVQDCGMIVDRLTAESQMYGGIIMGLGFALFENRILDRNTAQMVNPNMEWYLVPGISDIPAIDVTLVDQPERGVIGLGEPPVISTAAAIANAVSNATGVRIRKLPVTPDTVLAALQQERAGGTL
ncbi:MAG TPA: xanthine dehydrogenase family protein molybdopterin-binding subunit [Vicinamibacterales bacterium]|nr:xanthine dehydrogenase family protein molybdopterin-binding subunit [Vicinamibacterales bacterium]